MPGPWSSTVSVAVGQPDRDRAAGRAPLGGVVEQVGDGALDGRGLALDPPGQGGDVELAARRAQPHPRDGPVDHLGEVEGLHDVGQRLVAGQLDEVADEVGQLLDLGADVVQQLGLLLGRSPPVSSAWVSRSRFVRSDVSGVRSSWPASATSRRCRSARGRQGREHRVERRGEPGDLVVALDRQRVELLGPGVLLDRRGQPAYRPQPVAGHAPPGAPAATTPARPNSSITAPSRSAPAPAAPGTGPGPARCPAAVGTAATR